MIRKFQRYSVAFLAGLVVLGSLSSQASAQPILTPRRPPTPINPNFQVTPFNSPVIGLRQAAFNTAVLGGALRQLPPQAFGYNPALNPIPPAAFTRPVIPNFSPVGTLAPTAVANPYNVGGPGTASLSTNPYAPDTGAVLDNFAAMNAPWTMANYPFPMTSNTTPLEGYLRGVASVTTANGLYHINIQQARLQREQARQAAIETRRKLFDEARYELMHRPDPEKIRQRQLARALDRARSDPPHTEVWSGKSLNDLFRHIAAEQSKGNKGRKISLDPDVMKHINLTPLANRANPGLLKDNGKLQWPTPLQGKAFEQARTKLERLLEHNVQQLKFGNKPVSTELADMRGYHQELVKNLEASIDDMSPSEYIRADRYLRQVSHALRALEDPNVADYWSGAKGDSVGELVEFMTKKGLNFAPAVPGDESHYTALYHALRAFDASLKK